MEKGNLENKKAMDVVLFGMPLSSNLIKKTNKRYVHTATPSATIKSLLGKQSDSPMAMSPIRKSHSKLIEKSFESMKSTLVLEPATDSA